MSPPADRGRIHPLRALARKSWWHARNARRVLRAQSAFKLGFVLVFATAFEVGLLLLFLDGFRFLHSLGGVGTLIIGRLFSLFFLGMGSMLVVSSIVTCYSALYRSDEVAFLVERPYRCSQIVLYKFLEAAALSSWAFFFIIVPFVAAYALHEHISPLFAVWTILYSIPFLLVCAGVGCFVTIAAVRWAPRGAWVRYAVATGAVGGLAWLWQSARTAASLAAAGESSFNLLGLVPGLHLASNPLLPSWWMAEGIQSLAEGAWRRGTLLWAVLMANGLMAGLCVERLGAVAFYDGWQRAIAGRERPRRATAAFAGLDRRLAWLPSDIRALFMKDIRTFVRDPAQWSQALIFFGLLGLYFSNLRTFRYHALPESWRNTVAFLNVFSVSAVMCSLGSRFVYPQLSMEGHGFWILGLSPTTMRRVLLSKFALSALAMVTVGVALMALSASMLSATPVSRVLAMGLAAAIALAVCGLSTGLGALFIDLRERNPSAIVSGFGGTLNLVLSLGFMLAVILPFGFLYHLHFAMGYPLSELALSFTLAGLWTVALTAGATVLPLWLGCRSLAAREF